MSSEYNFCLNSRKYSIIILYTERADLNRKGSFLAHLLKGNDRLKFERMSNCFATKPMKRDCISPFFSSRCTTDCNHESLGWVGFTTAGWTAVTWGDAACSAPQGPLELQKAGAPPKWVRWKQEQRLQRDRLCRERWNAFIGPTDISEKKPPSFQEHKPSFTSIAERRGGRTIAPFFQEG